MRPAKSSNCSLDNGVVLFVCFYRCDTIRDCPKKKKKKKASLIHGGRLSGSRLEGDPKEIWGVGEGG